MQTTRYNISEKNNIKLAVIADLHGKLNIKIINNLIKEKPDYIISPGDFFDRHKLTNEKIREDFVSTQLRYLRGLLNIAPVIMSVGNHESHLTEEEIDMVKSTGAIYLDNSYVIINDIAFGGLSSCISYNDLHVNKKEYSSINESFINEYCKLKNYKVLLSHHPEYFDKYLYNKDIDLILSGHAHGGQIRIFGKGIFSPGQGFFPKYTSGKYKNMIISRGLVNTVKIPRLFNRGEILYINI